MDIGQSQKQACSREIALNKKLLKKPWAPAKLFFLGGGETNPKKGTHIEKKATKRATHGKKQTGPLYIGGKKSRGGRAPTLGPPAGAYAKKQCNLPNAATVNEILENYRHF